MDNFELRVWLELWKEEQEKVLLIRSAYVKSEMEIVVLKELLGKLQERDAKNELKTLEKPVLNLLKIEIESTERYFEKMQNEFQKRAVDLMVMQEKIKIIEAKIGSDTMLSQEKDGLLKNIFMRKQN